MKDTLVAGLCLRQRQSSTWVRVCTAEEAMLNEQMHCAWWHLSISARLCPQTEKCRDICHHPDKAEYGMTEISNLHNKQWNSNYHPTQTIFPAVTFGLWDCSIIHWCSPLCWKKGKSNKSVREKAAEGRVALILVLKHALGQIWIKQSSIHFWPVSYSVNKKTKQRGTLYYVSCEMSEGLWHFKV